MTTKLIKPKTTGILDKKTSRKSPGGTPLARPLEDEYIGPSSTASLKDSKTPLPKKKKSYYKKRVIRALSPKKGKKLLESQKKAKARTPVIYTREDPKGLSKIVKQLLESPKTFITDIDKENLKEAKLIKNKRNIRLSIIRRVRRAISKEYPNLSKQEVSYLGRLKYNQIKESNPSHLEEQVEDVTEVSSISITSAKFTPESNQLLFAEVFSRPEAGTVLRRAYKILAKETGVDNDTWKKRYYMWKKNPNFEEWLGDFTRTEVQKRIGRAHGIAEHYALRGSFHHLNLLVQMNKEFTPESKHLFEGRTTAELEYFSEHGRWPNPIELDGITKLPERKNGPDITRQA